MRLTFLEVEKRNESFLASVKHLECALREAEKFPEYPEHNMLVQELLELREGLITRMLSYVKTTDKGMMVRIHQLQIAMESR